MNFAAYYKFAKRNINRTPFQAAAASLAMFSAFLALISFLLISIGLQSTLHYYESRPQVIAFFKDGTTEEDIQAIENNLKSSYRATQTKYISQEEALQIYKRLNQDKDPLLTELVTASTLPPSLEISTATLQDLAPVAEILKQEPVVEDVVFPEDVVANLSTATLLVRIIGGVIVSYLILYAIMQILMIIGFKIRLKRNEIETMRLLGASTSFIRMPFILEGMFYGIVGAASSWVVIYILLWYFTPYIQGSYPGELRLLPVNPLLMLALLLTSILLACIVGALGSFAATRRYLRI